MGKVSRDLLDEMTKAEGFCCPHAYLTLTASIPTGGMAKRLGIEKRTLQKWRAALRDGKLKGCHLCLPATSSQPDQGSSR